MKERPWLYYATIGTQDALGALSRHGGIELRHRLHGELDNIVTAWHRSQGKGDTSASVNLALAATEILAMAGPVQSAVDICQKTPAMSSIAGESLARMLRGYAAALFMQGQYSRSRDSYEQAIRIHEAEGNLSIIGELQGNIGLLALRVGNIEEARSLYLQSIETGKAFENHRNVAIVTGNFAPLHLETGEPDRARELLSAALATHQRVGNRRSEGITRGNLGLLLMQAGDHATARQHYKLAIQIHRECRNLRGECIMLFNAADLDYIDGDLIQAGQRLEVIYRKVKAAFPNLLSLVLGLRAKIRARNGDHSAAFADITRAEALVKEWDYKIQIAMTYAKKATVLGLAGAVDQAKEALQIAMAMHDELGSQDPDLVREIQEVQSVLVMS